MSETNHVLIIIYRHQNYSAVKITPLISRLTWSVMLSLIVTIPQMRKTAVIKNTVPKTCKIKHILRVWYLF